MPVRRATCSLYPGTVAGVRYKEAFPAQSQIISFDGLEIDFFELSEEPSTRLGEYKRILLKSLWT